MNGRRPWRPTLRRVRASRVADAIRGRRANVAAAVVGIGVLLAVAPSAAIAARTGSTASAADTSALGDFAPTFHCRGTGSPSLSGTGLNGTDLELSVGHTGHDANRVENVTLAGTLHFTLDAKLSGRVRCEAAALAPVPDLPSVRVGPDFSIETTGTVDGDFTWTPSIHVSFDLSRHGFTHPVLRFVNHSGVVLTGDGTARLDLLLKATAGTRAGEPLTAGLTAAVGPEITATASASTADHTLCWSITGDLAARLHAYFDVWHWLKANKTWSAQSRAFGFAPQCTSMAPPPPVPPPVALPAPPPPSPWSAPRTIDQGNSLASVSCPTTSFCAAVDSAGNLLTDTGGVWSTPQSIDGSTALVSIACTSASFCVADDTQGAILVEENGRWTISDSTNNTLGQVSCVSSSFCVADGYDGSGGNVFTWNGTSWSAPSLVDPGYKLHSISCTSATFCVAGASVNVFTWNGSTWSAPDPVDPSNGNGTGLPSVSCVSESFCATGDANGNVLTYNGSSWTTPQDVDGSTTIDAVSCTSNTFCAAVDADGNALTYNGSTWTSPQDVDSANTIDWVSCASESFCVAVDDQGDVIEYT